jgi:WhiB family redox-sensing transcriptional regulator
MIDTPTFPLKPLVENWVWQSQAACQGMDTTSFFHPPRERGKTRRDRVAAAKRICHQCPVIAQCLEHALRVREPYGVWGGRSEEERAVLLGVVSLRYSQEGPPGARRDRPRRRTPALSGTAP